ncbi:MAG: sugar ABC transporter permease [Lachnospiraceae bacterium]|nr:sugar ABC transporter permease [Lachnospiraceae bacterium]
MKNCLGKTERRRKRQGQSRITAGCFLAPSLCGVLLFQALPFLDVVRRSFLDAMGRSFVGMANYAAVWGNEAFRMAAKNTLYFFAAAVPALYLVSLALSLLVYRPGAGQRLFKTSLVLPMVLPAAAMALVWRILFCPDGLWNQLLYAFTGKPWEQDWVHGKAAFPILVSTYLWKNIGYDMLLWLAGLSAIPQSLYDAARVDGAGEPAQLRYITLPCLQGTMGLVLVLSVVNSFRVYREAYLLAGSYPDLSIYMLPHLFSHWFLTLDIQKMSTAAVFLVLASLPAWGFGRWLRRSGKEG